MRAPRLLVGGVLVLTGFSALGLQVAWQRTVSLHVGADTASTAVVVSGFLAGLGTGSILGGLVADRVGRRAAVSLFACAEGGVGLFAIVSTWALRDLFVDVAPSLGGSATGSVLTFLILMVPTTLMGMSLPLAARLVASGVRTVGSDVGWIYAANTFGGALGALVVGWHLLGTYGFLATTWICSAGSLAASTVLFLAAYTIGSGEARNTPAAAPPSSDDGRPVFTWYVLYALSGALALGLQQTFFRLVSATSRSNSYTFATVLALYLLTFAGGVAVGSRLVNRSKDPRRVFLWLQFGVGVAALASLVTLTGLLGELGMGEQLAGWFNGDGFAPGYDSADTGDLLVFGLLLPMLLVCPAVLLMGAGFPFVERVVVERLDTVGSRTGALVAANTFGNVAGVLLTSFVVFDLIGTAGAHRLLAGALLASGVAAIALGPLRTRRVLLGGAGVLGGLALVVAAPDNQRLWEFLRGSIDDQEVLVAEDAACASVIESNGDDRFQLSINGASQNGYPYDDFHVLIGLLPSLMADEAPESLAVGFGIGSTSFAMLSDRLARTVTSVELCGGHYEVADRLAERGLAEFVTLRDDPRHGRLTADGRNHLLASDESYDVVAVDTLRVTSAFSGQHFSRDFYELVADSMEANGILAQWVPTWRVQNSAAQVFPFLVTATVAEYGDSVFMLAAKSAIEITGTELVERFDERAASAFEPAQRERLRAFLASWSPTCVTDGATVPAVPEEFENTDLAPRDEFHMNNGFIGESQTYRAC